ncbi:MAG: ABC-F family ATP-binding cassette domain-containing protein [Chloroflexota bacterium]|nr:ABC-F family ATP-binding cassette domain-containing protein [Chloroflexota bacterium]
MLSLSKVSFAWGPQEVLREVSLFVGRGEKVGLAGVNGAGKSTLLHLAAGLVEPDDGGVSRPNRTGMLPQEPEIAAAFEPEATVMDVVMSSGPTAEIAARLSEAERRLATASDDELTEAVEEYGQVEEEFRNADGYRAQSDAGVILSGLGLGTELADRALGSLSSGQRTRVEMARVLASKADLLLLDEPTNHLDVDGTRWLMGFLADSPAAVLIVSHDLRLLDHAITRVYELDGMTRKATAFKGTYSEYLVWSEEQRAALEVTRQQQQRRIDRLQASTDRLRAHSMKSEKVARRVKVMDRRLERMREEQVELPLEPGEIGMRVGQAPRSGRVALRVEGVAHAYGSNRVLRDVSLELERGQTLAVIGRNGAGKSTLLNIAAGVLEADQGSAEVGHNISMAHFNHAVDPGLGRRSAYDFVRSLLGPVEPTIRSFLATLMFHEDHIYRPLRTLSAGERARLAIAGLMLERRNLLLLDEPNSNLDRTTQAWLVEALQSYGASLVVVSHDVEFVAGLQPDWVLLMPEERLEAYAERHLGRVALV